MWQRAAPVIAQYFLSYHGFSIALMLCLAVGLESRMVTLPYRAIVLICSAAVFWRLKGRMTRLDTKWFYCFLTFAILYMIRLTYHCLFASDDLSLKPWEYWIYLLGICFFPLLGFLVQMDRDQRAFGLQAILIGGIIASLLSMVFYGDFLGLDMGRLPGTSNEDNIDSAQTISPLLIGYTGALQACLSIYILFQKFPAKKRIIFLAVVSLCCSIVPIVVGASRGSVLAIFAIIALIFFNKLKRIQKSYLALIPTIALFLGGLIYALYNPDSFFVRRITETGYHIEEGTSKAMRIFIWQDAIEQFLANPILGSGLEETHTQTYPHNLIIESFMATGIIGGFFFCAFLYATLRRSLRLFESSSEVGWVAVIYIVYLTEAMFSGSIYNSYLLYYSAFAVLATYQSMAHNA